MELLLKAGTAVIADVFDSFGMLPPVLSDKIGPITPYPRFAGPAYTIGGRSVTTSETGDRAKLGAIDGMPPGVVPVWAGTDIQGVCCFGDLLAEAMNARGCVGVVVDGGVRDTGYLRELGLPVVARYRTPAQAIGRWKVTAHQVPVQVRGGLQEWITVAPGDIVVADEDGVIAIPSAELRRVQDKVTEWAGTEEVSRAVIRDGMPLLTALERFGHL
ncbi:RraA family protein [Sphaerisporangium perillae]|uniref:RraA family protein n=1 Tax=Sphaerisporangium perillae TaxID=2935860 RepID=UPI00200C997F|nr:RraA family protein [Sphaerisporangium perillae]